MPAHRTKARSPVRRKAALLACLAALGACSPEAGPHQPQQGKAQPKPEAAGIDLNGRWRILSIDGRPPAGRGQGERAPAFTFRKGSFGGSVGCNSVGGLGLAADGHFAIHSWEGTAIGCPAGLEAQEQALASLFFARPLISSPVPGRVRFEGGGHSLELELERSGPAASVEEPAAPAELADTAWRITSMDGQEASSTPAGRVLRFGRDDWRGLASCATLFGTWRRQGDRILAGRVIASTEQNCRPDHARIDDSFADLMRSNPRYLVGPNGELLLAGAGHSLTGQRLVRSD